LLLLLLVVMATAGLSSCRQGVTFMSTTDPPVRAVRFIIAPTTRLYAGKAAQA